MVKKRPVRPEIDRDVGEKVKEFKRRHRCDSEKEVYQTLVNLFINDKGKWKNNAPDELKEKLGREEPI